MTNPHAGLLPQPPLPVTLLGTGSMKESIGGLARDEVGTQAQSGGGITRGAALTLASLADIEVWSITSSVLTGSHTP